MNRKLFLPLLFSLILTGCSLPFAPQTTAAPQATARQDATPTLAATVAPAPPATLTVCLGQEPNTLYPYANPNVAARDVLAAIYDGPLDVFSNGYQAVILDKIPSLQNGDAQRVPVKVKRGDAVVDINGQPVALDTGVTIFPSGCNDLACALRFDGQTELQLDQMVVTFRLKPGLLWSDGAPLTAADSVYAFALASDPTSPVDKYLIDRTQSYEALDEISLQWWGRPGFIDPSYADNFWAPLPKHAWGAQSAADLLHADLAARPPLGWGPYIFKEWTPGQYIRLEKNPNYFRAAENLPFFESLVFRFLPDAESGISALSAGECDLLDTSLRLEAQLTLLTQMQKNGQARLAISTTPLMERLDLGLTPASYDDGPGVNDRPDLFGDVRTRQAIAFCLDRQKVVDSVFSGLTNAPDSFVPDTHPLYNGEIAKYPHDSNRGIALLEQVGWKDEDGNPATPRTALNISGILSGTPLTLNYWTSGATQRRQVAEILSASLAECGIGVTVKYFDPNSLYAPGPGGPLFGRQFDLAEYAITTAGSDPACSAFTSDSIPDVANGWLGVNLSGYKNPDFDTLCAQARHTLPDDAAYAGLWKQMQAIYANDLPSIPLYQRLKVVVARPDFCNLNVDATTLFDLWNLEEYAISADCVGQ
ncbi:MAG: peptide ABC transporter substrate-binding protein [Anaerolineales bacterium]